MPGETSGGVESTSSDPACPVTSYTKSSTRIVRDQVAPVVERQVNETFKTQVAAQVGRAVAADAVKRQIDAAVEARTAIIVEAEVNQAVAQQVADAIKALPTDEATKLVETIGRRVDRLATATEAEIKVIREDVRALEQEVARSRSAPQVSEKVKQAFLQLQRAEALYRDGIVSVESLDAARRQYHEAVRQSEDEKPQRRN